MMSTISIKKAGTDLGATLELLLDPFAARMPLAGSSVLIKPNLVEPLPFTTGQTTNPALVESIIAWCKARGARKIAVGEGPSYFQPKTALKACFLKTGMATVAQRQHVPWILFDEGPFRAFTDYSPRTPAAFSLSEHGFTWDHIINVPVPKTHYLTRVSIAMKNLKGFIKREDKPSFHHCGTQTINGSVTALNNLIRPLVNIVDCTAPTHRNDAFLLAGMDIVATDAVTASLMGFNPQEIQTIRLGFEDGLGEMDLTHIEITGDDLKDMQMNLEQPACYLRRTFPALTVSASTACSGCLIPLFSSLRKLEQEKVQFKNTLCIALGKEPPQHKYKKIIFVGQCTRPYSADGPLLTACPPTKEEVFAFLKDNL